MQIRFDNSPANHDIIMNQLRDLIYRVERIGYVDVTRLGLLFAVHGLSTTHPTVYEALSPALMDGTITLEALDNRLHLFYEVQATQNAGQLAFPTVSPILNQIPLPSAPPSPTIALPASLPPRANICPNCKKSGHSIEFCISPGGKMEGLSTTEAIARQRAARDTSRTRPPLGPASSNSLVKIDNDGTVWIGGVKYQPAADPAVQASVAEVDVEAAMTAADQGEYMDWWTTNNNDPSWGSADLNDMASFFLAAENASEETSLLAHGLRDPPLYLDSGASTHISCVRSDFSDFTAIEPQSITGVGNASVSATGMGTVEILIPETSARLTLRHVLYAPNAGVRLISISRLDDSGHHLSFANGLCTVVDRSSGRKLVECTRNSSRLYVLPGSIQSQSSFPIPPTSPCIAFPSLNATPNLETWHRRLGHANFRTVLDMA